MMASTLTVQMLAAIEAELKRQVMRLHQPDVQPFREMLAYHLGWEAGSAAGAGGKRIRPLMVLLSNAACDGEWQHALPAAAAIELVHNFSLVHDDIQDHSDTRRGRETVWRRWGVPMAINVGDALFVLSSRAVLDLQDHHAPAVVLAAARLLHESTLQVTLGQYLDISYEQRSDLAVRDYWTMTGGKTAALLAAAAHLGALLAGVEARRQESFRLFAHHLGLAFQVQDDLLGIWGDEALTGKSASNDLVTGKKSLPVLMGLGNAGGFARRWQAGPITAGEVSAVANLLEAEGIRAQAETAGREQMQTALEQLESTGASNEAAHTLRRLAVELVGRTA